MGKWDEFNRKFDITPADWAEWRKTKHRYKKGFFKCPKCGASNTVSPFLAFLIVKRKMICPDCEAHDNKRINNNASV